MRCQTGTAVILVEIADCDSNFRIALATSLILPSKRDNIFTVHVDVSKYVS